MDVCFGSEAKRDFVFMHNMITRHARIAGAAVLLGSLALAGAHAADWDQLDSNGWKQNESASKNLPGKNGASAAQAGNAGIAAAFEQLGMAAPRAECYEDVLAEKLSPEEQQKAAAIVANASDAEEVRTAVLDAGETIVGGFSAADVSCPEGMTQ